MERKNMLGAFEGIASESVAGEPGALSFRNSRWTDLEEWRTAARGKVEELIARPPTENRPAVETRRRYEYDGLEVEELAWAQPYGPPTEAVFLKPAGGAASADAGTGGGAGTAGTGLPGILAFHDHGGVKNFGWSKIVRLSSEVHPTIDKHLREYYGGRGWASELAKRGYAVLVPDAFAFGSRRIEPADLPERAVEPLMSPPLGKAFGEGSGSLSLSSEQTEEEIVRYNAFAAVHESVMAKSLFSAGTTWPGVFLAEDQAALDVLASRDDVDASRLGCGGLSGGGLRTNALAGMDDRIRCSVTAGFMTTWRDFALNVSYTHTWMTYVPLLPRYLDFPELLGLRVPLPALVLHANQDQLFTLSEVRRAEAMLTDVYGKAGASESFRMSYHEGPHKFDVPMQEEAFAWFDRWLR